MQVYPTRADNGTMQSCFCFKKIWNVSILFLCFIIEYRKGLRHIPVNCPRTCWFLSQWNVKPGSVALHINNKRTTAWLVHLIHKSLYGMLPKETPDKYKDELPNKLCCKEISFSLGYYFASFNTRGTFVFALLAVK